MSVDKVQDGVKLTDMNDAVEQLKKVRQLKAKGLTYDEAAKELGISKAMANYYGKARPGERICRGCCRPFQR